MRTYPSLIAALLLSVGSAAAQEVPLPPPMPESVPGSEQEELQPEVTIIQRGEDVIEEYRSGGQLYMIKITPSMGKPYYLIDSDGDGSLETRRNDFDNPEIIQWRIFTW